MSSEKASLEESKCVSEDRQDDCGPLHLNQVAFDENGFY